MLKLFFSIALFVAANALIYCPPDACNRINCVSEPAERCTARGGRYEPKGGECGCCSNCVRQLDEGENCLHEIILGAPKKIAECGQGLICDRDDILCRKLTCAEKKIVVQEKIKQGGIMGIHVPNCVPDGTYHPKQCHEAQCFCVSKEGETIPGYEQKAWEAEYMDCKCARDLHEYKKLGMLGRKFACDEQGNYEPIQCHGSMCYCADEEGHKRPGVDSVPIHQKKLLEGKCW